MAVLQNDVPMDTQKKHLVFLCQRSRQVILKPVDSKDE